MKRLLSLLVTCFLVIGPVGAVFAQAPHGPAAQPPSQPAAVPPPPEITAAAPEGTGIENVGSSTLANVTPQPVPIGTAFDLCFTVFAQSPDAEYLDHFEVDLPNNWVVNSVAPNSTPPANGCGGALPPVVGVNAGNVVYWQSTGYPPQTGCGAWNGGGAGANFDFCANVTIPNPSGVPWILPWTYIGDGWGGTPHEVSGSYGPVQALLPITWEKFVDGEPWVPGMTITRQTSDTIVVQEVLHLDPLPPLQGHPPAPTSPRPVSAIPQPAVEVVGAVPSSVLPPSAPSDWAAPEAVLWDNGPLVTHPGACSGQDASRLQTTLGMNTLGFGHQFSVGNRMADDFTVTDPAGWQIDTITFFAYQSSAPSSPSPITGVYLQIWNGPPDNPGSSVVWGDLTTNRLLSSTFSGIQRDSETTNCANNRYIFADVASVGTTLPPGTYWLDWMTDGSASYSGPWAPPITILGQTTTGNALQYTTSSGAWAPALDSGTSTQQGMPFVIQGTVGGTVFAQIETWDPAHLNLLGWATTGGEVAIYPGRLEWTGQIFEPTTIILTKWFHVEPCTWSETLLWEELWLDSTLLEERPVLIHKLPPDLWINAAYNAPVQAGELADFTLHFGNNGGFENDVVIRNEFPPEAPFVSSVPPPTSADPGGLWAEWAVGGLPMGAQGSIDVTVMIQPGLPVPTTITIWDGIFNHVGDLMDQVFIIFHVIPPIGWEKLVDGEPWHPGMHIMRVTSDTIVIEEVLHLMIPPLQGDPFVPVNVRGDAPEGEVWLDLHSPAPPTLGQPAAPPDPDAVLWDQPLSAVNQAAYVDQDFPDYPAYSSFLADDFLNAQGWQISTIFVPGDGWNGFTTLFNATALTWQLYADCGGVPCGDPSGGGSPPVWTLTLPPTDPQVVITTGAPGGYPSNTTLNLAAPLNLPPGHWWLVFYPTMAFSPYGQYGRQPSDTTNGYTGQFINPGGGFGYGTAWQNWTVIGAAQQDIAFRLEGAVIPSIFTLVENWNPAHLQLLDWAADYGVVDVGPGGMLWAGEVTMPMTVHLTKCFHVEPGDWPETLLWEELLIDGGLLEQRPVVILHGYLVYLPVIMRASP